MKRLSIIAVTLAVVFAYVSPSFATPSAAKDQFIAGAKDVVMSPLTVKDSVMTETKGTKAHVYPLALVGGLLKGGFYMGKHIIDGTWTIAKSPLEITK